MPEKCPLAARGLHWDGDIPDVCQRQCGATWERAIATQQSTTDTFSISCEDFDDLVEDPEKLRDCEHEIENGGMAVQRVGEGSLRAVSLLNVCQDTGVELFANEYDFTCLHDTVD